MALLTVILNCTPGRLVYNKYMLSLVIGDKHSVWLLKKAYLSRNGCNPSRKILDAMQAADAREQEKSGSVDGQVGAFRHFDTGYWAIFMRKLLSTSMRPLLFPEGGPIHSIGCQGSEYVVIDSVHP